MVTVDLFIEDFHLKLLLFGQRNILDIVENSHFLSPGNETIFELDKELS